MYKSVLFILLLILLQSCSSKWLGTKQAKLARHSCPIEKKHCFMLSDSKRSVGKISMRGSYSLKHVEGSKYVLEGTTKLIISNNTFRNIEHIFLRFIFFKGDLVVHEEKVYLGLKGIGKWLKFSADFNSEEKIKSSRWMGYSTRITE